MQIEQQFVVAHRMHDPSRQPPFGRVAGERFAMLFGTVCRERLHVVVIELPPPAGKNDVLVTDARHIVERREERSDGEAETLRS